RKYLRGIGWRHGVLPCRSRTIAYSEVDDPLPRPPTKEFENRAAMNTISQFPDLFHVNQVINADHLEALLQRHPNRPFMKSVLIGLREGFWP
ncbi:hypothetical protein GYMLUDRAFT_145463, partial [Collybiopsis luxurians FD-317 M1]